MTTTRCADRVGGAVVLAVLLTLAISALAHGLFLLAHHEGRTGDAAEHVLRTRLAAEGAANRLARSADTLALAGVPRWGSTDSISELWGAVDLSGSLTRLSSELWLAEGSARSGPVVARAARPVWVLDPWARAVAMPGIVVTESSASSLISGAIDGTRVDSLSDPTPPGGCPLPLDSVETSRAPLLHAQVPPTWEPLGFAPWDALLRSIPTRVSRSGTPSPVERMGTCATTESWNWGDPARPGGVCETHLAVVAADTALRVVGGVGQGVLLSRHDIEMRDTEFHGLVATDGRVSITGSSRVVGMVFARGGLLLDSGAEVVGSRCWMAAALTHRLFDEAQPVPGSGWIRPLR